MELAAFVVESEIMAIPVETGRKHRFGRKGSKAVKVSKSGVSDYTGRHRAN